MKRFFLVSCASILLFSCGEPSRELIPITDTGNLFVEELQLALGENEVIVFMDSSGMGAAMDRAILDLHFSPNFKLMAYTWGNGFSYHHGTYAFPGNNRVEIHLDDQDWPELILSKEGDRFLLKRADGLRSLTKHIVFTNKNGSRSLVNDGDIYPEAELRIFPFTQKISDVEQGGGGQPATRPESK